MDMFVIQGGTSLTGRIPVSGAKNATLPIMAASLAADGEVLLENVPDLVDVRTLGKVLQSLGMMVESPGAGLLSLRPRDQLSSKADYELVCQMRASVCVLGPLLAKRGQACVSLPGGCNIGYRPIDLHLKGLAALGAEIEVRNGYVHATAKRLKGASIFLGGVNGSTVTGTCNVMTAATLAKGTTVITAAACEPEVVALANALNAMGAKITGQGTPCLEIEGVDQLVGARVRMIPDRVEAATLLIAGAITRGNITVDHACPGHMTAVLDVLQEMGYAVRIHEDSVEISVAGPLKPFDFTALPYPGVPTDVQAQLMALACTLPGSSVIRDHVFPDRFMHVSELCRMGGQIRQQGSMSIVSGVASLNGAEVMASDLRASAALVLAGLAADGETVIRRIYHLDRGYEQLERKLSSLGATVCRLRDPQFPEASHLASTLASAPLVSESQSESQATQRKTA